MLLFASEFYGIKCVSSQQNCLIPYLLLIFTEWLRTISKCTNMRNWINCDRPPTKLWKAIVFIRFCLFTKGVSPCDHYSCYIRLHCTGSLAPGTSDMGCFPPAPAPAPALPQPQPLVTFGANH